MQRSLFKKVFLSFLSLTLIQLINNQASAMPFNTDMFEVQPSADAVARKKPAESVAVGSLERIKPDLTTSWVQKNPFYDKQLAEDTSSKTFQSIQRGKRHFEKNCSVCHGNFVDAKHVPSDLMMKGIPSIDLSSEAVRYDDPGTNLKPKPDAHFFTYIFNGGVLMPAYGYKLSNSEVWDIVSYIRDAQVKASAKN